MKPKNNEFYVEKFRLRISDFNRYDVLAPHAVLDLFQDVAGTHADYIGVGFNKMIEKNLIWVLLRTKYIVLKNPPLHKSVLVKTWPKIKGRVDFDREYEIFSEDGELLVKGISKWVVVNKNTRRISLIRDVNYECDMYEKNNFSGSFDKIEDFNIDDCPYSIQRTTFLDLDHNGHINNANYAKYAINSIDLKENEIIKEFEINHIKELQPNTSIKNYYKRDGKVILVKGIVDDTDISYLAKITLA